MPLKWNVQDLPDAVKKAYCLSDICRNLGLEIRGRNFDTIKLWIAKLNLDVSHFKSADQLRKERCKKVPPKLECEIFTDKAFVKRSIVKNAYKKISEYRCSECGLADTWNNKKLVLQLDHINGISSDHRKENLRWLCPNCHTQTPTYAGKSAWLNLQKVCTECNTQIAAKNKFCSRRCNLLYQSKQLPKKTKIDWPDKKLLLSSVELLGYKKTYRILGVSDTAIKKHLNKNR